ncbi:hypothetical protein ACPOLB_16945 [Rubrivivax sp. RP6-9]|uniref:hypothetical protein n=1 Tax=Rubrivivax sp. RP6-9 TaxID=3415750 RepID=UPI003CC64362
MFESTLPVGAPDLMRVSAFQRYLEEAVPLGDADAGSSRLSALSPSLMQDLLRFEQGRGPGDGLELLEVMAACVRHGCSLLLHLQDETRVLPLTVFPNERLVHCPVPMEQLLAARLTELRVLHVERAVLHAPGHPDRALVGEAAHYAPLGPLLWELALRGAREELLPEIAGNTAYRIAPGLELQGLNLSGSLAAAVQRLQRATTNLREISDWPGFDRARAMRMLNGLYLQAGLMVTRTHPAATNDGWFSGGNR